MGSEGGSRRFLSRVAVCYAAQRHLHPLSATPPSVAGPGQPGALLGPWRESSEIPLRCPTSTRAVCRAPRVKVGSGRDISFPVRGFVLTRLVSLFVMVKGMALGGRFELRLANGGSPPGPLWVFAALPPPPSGGWGAMCSGI